MHTPTIYSAFVVASIAICGGGGIGSGGLDKENDGGLDSISSGGVAAPARQVVAV